MPAFMENNTIRINWNGRNRYVHNNGDANSLMGFLNEGGGWSFWNRNDGYLWSSVYGWLHDYFFSSVLNCGGGRYAQNCYNAGNYTQYQDHELYDQGGILRIRTINYLNNCNCDCSNCCSCFPAGSLVLMADGTQKLIEDIVETDLLMGADGLPAKLKDIYKPKLGEDRKMLSFAEDSNIRWSDEHLFWTKKDNKQWWWVHNHKNWIKEVYQGYYRGLKDNYSHFTGNDVEFANLEGFVKRTVVDVTDQYLDGPNTQLYLPVTENDVPIIVNGYVVAAGTDESKYMYSNFNWNQYLLKINKLLGK